MRFHILTQIYGLLSRLLYDEVEICLESCRVLVCLYLKTTKESMPDTSFGNYLQASRGTSLHPNYNYIIH